jgi:succinate dehydrogenase / fumarate reductase cytochrome b subunit
MLERSRPLSPFLNYRWQYTNTLSILHRVTGIVLAGGYLLLVRWLMVVAQGEVAYGRFVDRLTHPLFKVLLGLGFASFAYHFCNGLRHLCWDAGFGLERREARRSAWLVVAGVLLIIALVGSVLHFREGGMP